MALREFYNTGDDIWITPSVANWYAMTWTTTAAYSITSVKLKLYRGGTPPANVIVSIRDTVAGKPSGGDLTSGSIAGVGLTGNPGIFEEILLTPYDLEDAKKYAIVVRCDTVSCSWRIDNSSPSYGGGNGVFSNNSGSSWTTKTYDMMFEVYGSNGQFSELSGTIAAVSVVENADLDLITWSNLSGTIAAVSTVGPSSLGSTIVELDIATAYIKRLVVAGSNKLYYEDI